MNDPQNRPDLLDEAWRILIRGARDAKSPARYIAFATTSPDGWPETRTVALRGARRSDSELEVHTDTLSHKMTSLDASPRAELMIWEPRAKVQIRARCVVSTLRGADIADRWSRTPEGSRSAYGTKPPPGSPIQSATDYTKPHTEARFVALICKIQHLDVVDLHEPHRRALFTAKEDWAEQWLSP